MKGSTQGLPPTSGQPLVTISYDGRFWDVHLEFEESLRHGDAHRAALAFVPTDRAEHEAVVRTISVIIEPTYEEAVRRARQMEPHQLEAFLRSLLP